MWVSFFFCFGIEFVVSSLNRSMWAMRLCVRVYGCMFDEKLCICAVFNATDKYQNWIWRGRIYVSCDDYCYCLCYVCQQFEITLNTKKNVLKFRKWSVRFDEMVVWEWKGGYDKMQYSNVNVLKLVWAGEASFYLKKKVNATETEKNVNYFYFPTETKYWKHQKKIPASR